VLHQLVKILAEDVAHSRTASLLSSIASQHENGMPGVQSTSADSISKNGGVEHE
jgi:hypothetical protein